MCHRGRSCPFKHAKNQAVVCKHWLRGLCKKLDVCDFLHEYDLSKMPECQFYADYQDCANPECLFIHVTPDTVRQECPWYARGFCKNGPTCRNKHTKKVACDNYLLGLCPDGPACTLGHPKFELSREAVEAAAPLSRGARIVVKCHGCGEAGHVLSDCPNRRRFG